MQKLTKIKLIRVHYVPKTLEPGLLYVSEEFGAALHLCACGCGSKVSTPLGPTAWTVAETPAGPSLHPSVGNWQLACKSHYWITSGNILWSGAWTQEQVNSGRKVEEQRRRTYYDEMDRQRHRPLSRLWRWIKSLFG
jgi:hypothetical protein